MIPDTEQLNQYLDYLSGCFTARLKAVFEGQELPLPVLPKTSGQTGGITEFISSHHLSDDEQLILLLALAPHLYADFFDRLIQPFIHESGDFSQLGGVRSLAGRNFLPTGETAAFLIAGGDLKKRLEVIALFGNQHTFDRRNILYLQEVEAGEPVLNGRIILYDEVIEWLITGTRSIPKMSMRFPAQHLETKLDWNDVVLNPATLSQILELEEWVKHHDVLLNEWGMHRYLRPGYKALFHGPPGTGKTLTATLLGKYTGKPVFRIDLSMIVSKFIGETEKNLARLFAKAENKDWILFFDEADALFGKRTNVKDAHDKYANQEASYLLQKIEQYNGLVILATNFKNNIDDAFMRRFQSIVYFPLPNAGERLQIWKKAFPEKARLDQVNFEQLAKKYELSGSGIFSVVQFACISTLAQNSEEISAEIIIKGIQREYVKENRIW